MKCPMCQYREGIASSEESLQPLDLPELLIGLDLALPRGGGIAFVGRDFEGLQRDQRNLLSTTGFHLFVGRPKFRL